VIYLNAACAIFSNNAAFFTSAAIFFHWGNPLIMSIYYRFAPDWLFDTFDNIRKTLSTDSEPPELEVDPNLVDYDSSLAVSFDTAMNGDGESLGISTSIRRGEVVIRNSNKVFRSPNGLGKNGKPGSSSRRSSNRSSSSSSSSGSGSGSGSASASASASCSASGNIRSDNCRKSSKGIESGGNAINSRSNSLSTCQEDDDDDANTDLHVFDPVYGVIPRHIRDLWKRQEREARVKRETSISESIKKRLPPVRFSTGPSTTTRSPSISISSSSSFKETMQTEIYLDEGFGK
jgi:hypothetical protein